MLKKILISLYVMSLAISYFKFELNSFAIIKPVPVAQWIARWTSNPKVAGSNPAGDKLFCLCE